MTRVRRKLCASSPVHRIRHGLDGDRVGHGGVTGVARMDVVATIDFALQPIRRRRIAEDGVEIHHAVKSMAGPDPLVHGESNIFPLGRKRRGRQRSAEHFHPRVSCARDQPLIARDQPGRGADRKDDVGAVTEACGKSQSRPLRAGIAAKLISLMPINTITDFTPGRSSASRPKRVRSASP